MKKSVIVFFALFGLMCSEVGWSQNPNRFPLLRERLAQAKLREISQSLNLDQQTFEKFRPVYLEYEKEITAIDFRKLAPLMKVNPDSLSGQEAERLIENQLETAQNLITIRGKYYHEFKRVISPQQIIKLYQTEAEIRRKVMQEFKSRLRSR